MSAPFLRFGALFKDNAFLNDTLKLKSYASPFGVRRYPWCPVVGTPNKLCLFENFERPQARGYDGTFGAPRWEPNDRKRVRSSDPLVALRGAPKGRVGHSIARACDRSFLRRFDRKRDESLILAGGTRWEPNDRTRLRSKRGYAIEPSYPKGGSFSE